MDTQKIQTGARSTKGFTLVELIVVITILVILGTIAFLNLGGMSGSARDAQRTSDLNQINSQITTVQAKSGLVYSTLVTPNAASLIVSGATIAGNTVTTTSGSYSAGDLNYSVLNMDSAKFKDPVKGVPYKIGQTSLAGGQWEISAALEAHNGAAAALVMGTYRQRILTSTTSTGTVTGTAPTQSITLTSTPSNFKVGDWLISGTTAGTGTAQITAISTDTKTLTISGSMVAGAVSLAFDEVAGLTSSWSTTQNTNAVINGGTYLPY